MAPPILSQSPLVYAHRGASAELPENTLEAFARALERGADVLETDVHVTRDGRLVLSHDPTGQRRAGVSRAIADVSYAEVRAWDVGGGLRMPTLDEALDAFPDAAFNVDIKVKTPNIVPQILEVIARARAEDRVRIASFHGVNIRRARALGYGGRLGMGRTDLLAALFAPSWVASRLTRGSDAAQVPRRVAGVDFTRRTTIDRLHARGCRVEIWVVDDADEARALVRAGVDGVFTNDPRQIVPAVRGARDA